MAVSASQRDGDARPCERRRVAVAYSGGHDSTALLHATLLAAADADLEVIALHVHHGLSPNADVWLTHCQAQCSRWARAGRPIRFASTRLTNAPTRGESIEAWARESRYAALTALAIKHGASLIFLAHHRRDQAETMLLQALRGAGHAGLSAMPKAILRDGITWARPWLERSREDVDAYVRQHRLTHIEDESNVDPRYARNRLRLQVWPALTQAFPQAEAAFATVAARAQEASEALRELAEFDLSAVARDSGLNINAWCALSSTRRSNALRTWLKRITGLPASGTLIARLLVELPSSRVARWPINAGELRLHRGSLSYYAIMNVQPTAARESTLSIPRAGVYHLPGWAGALHVESSCEGGVPFAWIAHVELRERVGAERFQTAVGRPARSLKKQFQQASVPAWQRNGPLIFNDGQLVFVPGLGLDARVIGLPGQAVAQLHWVTTLE